MTSQRINRFEWFKMVAQVEGLTATAKALAAALAVQFANEETGQCNPSQETLADFLKVHRDTIKRALRELRKAGWLMSVGDGGRGRVPDLKFLCPTKVVPFRAAARSQNAAVEASNPPSERGADMPPQREKRGDDLRKKGGRFVPPLLKAEQSREQKERVYALFGKHRFRGNAYDGPVVAQQDRWQVLNPWAEWLELHHLPRLVELPITASLSDGQTAFLLPYRDPPTDDQGIAEAKSYFASLMDLGAASHAAQ